jgi:hypothetical protein
MTSKALSGRLFQRGGKEKDPAKRGRVFSRFIRMQVL